MKNFIALTGLISLVVFGGCTQVTDAPEVLTEINIDGNGDDWTGYPILTADPAGDQKGGGPDLGDLRAFSNDRYLYLFIEFISPGRSEEIRIEVTLANGDSARVIVDAETGSVQIRNPINKLPQNLPAQLTWGQGLEVKIPLEAFGQPLATLEFVAAKINMLDSGDRISGGEIFLSNEIDGIEFVESHNLLVAPTESEEFSLSGYFALPEGYEARLLFSPPAPDLIAITKSQDGTVFLQHGSLNAGISVFDVETREVTRIFDLPVQEQVSYIVGGPGDTVFVTVYGQGIMLVHSDGSSVLWSPDRGTVLFYTEDMRALGTDYGKTIVAEYFEGGGGSNTIATGFTHVYDLVETAEGEMYVSDFRSGDIIRLGQDGNKSVLVDQLLPFDPMDLALRSGSRLYVSTAFHGLLEVNTEDGNYTVEYPQGSTCALRDGDFIFVNDDLVMFTDPGAGIVTTLELTSGKDDLVVPNLGATRAAAIGPDQSLYFGTRSCPGVSDAQVIRMDQDGQMEVVIDELVGEVTCLAFDNTGGLYLGLHEIGARHRLLYFPSLDSSGQVVPGADGMHVFAVNPITNHLFGIKYHDELIYEITPEGVLRTFSYTPPEDTLGNSLAISGTGQLYVQGLEADVFSVGPTVDGWILKVDQTSGQAAEFYNYPRQGTLPFRVLTADSNGNVWWLINPEFIIARIEPGGNVTLFAQNLPIDSSAIAVDAVENVYMFSPGGIYVFFSK